MHEHLRNMTCVSYNVHMLCAQPCLCCWSCGCKHGQMARQL